MGSLTKNASAPMIVSTAEYFEDNASPAQMPVASHQPQAARPCAGNARTRQAAMPSNAAISGPSGKTQVAEVTPRTGAAFSTAAAASPARLLNRAAVTRYISTVDSTNSAMNGSRTTIAAIGAGEASCRPAQPPCDRRMIEIAELPLPAGGDHIALVDTEPDGRGKSSRSARVPTISSRQPARRGPLPCRDPAPPPTAGLLHTRRHAELFSAPKSSARIRQKPVPAHAVGLCLGPDETPACAASIKCALPKSLFIG